MISFRVFLLLGLYVIRMCVCYGGSKRRRLAITFHLFLLRSIYSFVFYLLYTRICSWLMELVLFLVIIFIFIVFLIIINKLFLLPWLAQSYTRSLARSESRLTSLCNVLGIMLVTFENPWTMYVKTHLSTLLCFPFWCLFVYLYLLIYFVVTLRVLEFLHKNDYLLCFKQIFW